MPRKVAHVKIEKVPVEKAAETVVAEVSAPVEVAPGTVPPAATENSAPAAPKEVSKELPKDAPKDTPKDTPKEPVKIKMPRTWLHLPKDIINVVFMCSALLLVVAAGLATWTALSTQKTQLDAAQALADRLDAQKVAESSLPKTPTLVLNQKNQRQGPSVVVNPSNIGKANPFTP